MLIDIATEELSHLEVIGTLVAMLNKGAKGELAEGVNDAAEQYRKLQGAGNDSHVTQVLYGGGPALTNSGGQLWNAGYIDTIGEPTADLRSNIAAEARAKIIYERLINVTDDPGVKDALVFLMTREVAHLQSFEKALYSISPNFPPGKQPVSDAGRKACGEVDQKEGAVQKHDGGGPTLYGHEPVFDMALDSRHDRFRERRLQFAEVRDGGKSKLAPRCGPIRRDNGVGSRGNFHVFLTASRVKTAMAALF